MSAYAHEVTEIIPSRCIPATILVVDDDTDILTLVKRCLEDHGHEVATAGTGAEALALNADQDFDLAIIDLRLPDLDGMILVKQFSTRLGLPVLVLSGLGETQQRIRGLEEGADDYITKPFEPDELAARIEAVLRARRQSQHRSFTLTGSRIKVDDWVVDIKRQTISDQNGIIIQLSNAEHKLLEALLECPNQVISRSQILSMTHGDEEATERSVDIQVTRLRKKLECNNSHPQLIRTVRRLGYMLVADVVTQIN